VVDMRWIKEANRYIFRCIMIGRLFWQMIKELPPDRQDYYIEMWRGIDNRIREEYHGTQDHPDRTT
jgi:hypothetical protein